jgi:heptosyltransferase-1
MTIPGCSPLRILLIKPSSLGDIVHALPVLAALRETWPDAHVAWLCGRPFVPLLERCPLIDEVIAFDRARYGRMWRSLPAFLDFWRFVGELRRRRFDLVVDLQGLIRSGLMALFSGARRRVGFAQARELAWVFYTQRVRCPDAAEHAVEKNLRVARALELATGPPRFPLGLKADETAAAQQLLSRAGGGSLDAFIAVVPGARWESKRWPAERLAQLIDAMHEEAMPGCVLLGSPEERDFAERVLAACRSRPLDLVGRTSVRELLALLSLAELVVCHDSGPMHLAAALDRPLVAIFGPTSPQRTGPYSPVARVVSNPVPCAPCFERKCPLGHHDCMRKLEVATVLEQVRRALSARV